MSRLDYVWRLQMDFPGHNFGTLDQPRTDGTTLQTLLVDGTVMKDQWARRNAFVEQALHGTKEEENFYYNLRLSVEAFLKSKGQT